MGWMGIRKRGIRIGCCGRLLLLRLTVWGTVLVVRRGVGSALANRTSWGPRRKAGTCTYACRIGRDIGFIVRR